jgi:hypothetical protein
MALKSIPPSELKEIKANFLSFYKENPEISLHHCMLELKLDEYLTVSEAYQWVKEANLIRPKTAFQPPVIQKPSVLQQERLKPSLKPDLKLEVQSEIESQLNDFKDQLEGVFKDQFEEDFRDQIKAEMTKELRTDFQKKLDQLIGNLQNEFDTFKIKTKDQLKEELTSKIYSRLFPDLERALTESLDLTLKERVNAEIKESHFLEEFVDQKLEKGLIRLEGKLSADLRGLITKTIGNQVVTMKQHMLHQDNQIKAFSEILDSLVTGESSIKKPENFKEKKEIEKLEEDLDFMYDSDEEKYKF